MIVAYMNSIIKFVSGYYHKKCPRIPRNQLPPGYFYTNMGACTPQPTFTGVFLHNMGVYTPQPALTGVFPHKYGCLYPAANFYRGISTQIWVPVPRSQLSPGYFRTNTGAYTPQSAFTGVFSHKYRCLCPALLLLAKAPHFLNINLVHARYKKARIPLQSGDAGILTLCIRIIHSYLRASSPGRLRCRHQ